MNPLNFPPHDLDTEKALVNVCLRDTDAFDDACEIVAAEHFYAPVTQTIWRTMCDLRASGQPVDAITVAAKLSTPLAEQFQTVLEDSSVSLSASVRNALGYANIVHEKWQRRELSRVADALRAGAASPDAVPDVVDRAAGQISDIAVGKASQGAVHVVDCLEDAIAKIRAAAASPSGMIGLATGFSAWDKIFGGMRDGDLTVVAGRPGMGKTALAIGALAGGAAKLGSPALVFSLEMPRAQLGLRLACSHAQIEYTRARDGNLEPDDWARLGNSKLQFNQWPFWIDDTSSISMTELRARTRRKDREMRAAGKRLRLVVIDYLQLMKGNPDEQSRERQVAELSRECKMMARDLEIPVVLLSQLNRGVEARPDKRPIMSDLRESGAIEQDADNIVFIYRDDQYNPKTCKLVGATELIVSKQRNGPCFTQPAFFDGRTMTFRDLTRDECMAAGLDPA